MDYQALQDDLTAALELDSPPIALTFVDSPPAGLPGFVDEVPSACALWRRAEAGVFYAPAEKHFNCPIGAMTMGFTLPEAVQQELMTAVTTMTEVGYISPDEPSRIPSTGKAASGIVYGPLAGFPLRPDVVLLWLTPRQAMLFGEAVGGTRWTASAPTSVFGRPACAALPIAMAEGRATLSLGCMGMRTFTEIAQDKLLTVLPGSGLEQLATNLAETSRANETMHAYYGQKKAALSRQAS